MSPLQQYSSYHLLSGSGLILASRGQCGCLIAHSCQINGNANFLPFNQGLFNNTYYIDFQEMNDLGVHDSIIEDIYIYIYALNLFMNLGNIVFSLFVLSLSVPNMHIYDVRAVCYMLTSGVHLWQNKRFPVSLPTPPL